MQSTYIRPITGDLVSRRKGEAKGGQRGKGYKRFITNLDGTTTCDTDIGPLCVLSGQLAPTHTTKSA